MGEMAKKIVKIDVDELIEVLNKAYAEEWLAYYQYWIGAKVAIGFERADIVGEFEEHAKEELKHAGWLADRIIQLGGVPLIKPSIILMWHHFCMIILMPSVVPSGVMKGFAI